MATGATILVVDDDDSIRVLMKSLLRQHGFSPRTASSGAAALEQVRENGVDLVLLDLGLQDIRGEELVARLREIDQEIPVVIVSGRHLSEDEVSTIGAVDALQKPFEIDELLRAIRRILQPIRC